MAIRDPHDPRPKTFDEEAAELIALQDRRRMVPLRPTPAPPAVPPADQTFTLETVADIDSLLKQLGTIFTHRLPLDDVLKVTDRWLKAYALKTKQGDPDDKQGSKFGAAP